MRTTNSLGHHIALSQDSKVSFGLHTSRLLGAVATCDLGLGTIYSPINVGGFYSIENHTKDTFYAGETIQLIVSKSSLSASEINVVSCDLVNVGTEFNRSGMIILNPWDDVFEVSPERGMVPLSNGSLHIEGDNGVFSVTVARGDDSTIAVITHVSYSILFYIMIDQRPCYFIIDPLLRISSNPPPPEQ